MFLHKFNSYIENMSKKIIKLENTLTNNPYGKGIMFFTNDLINSKNKSGLEILSSSSFNIISLKNEDVYDLKALLTLYYFHYDSKINKILTPPKHIFDNKTNFPYNDLEVLSSIVNNLEDSSSDLYSTKKFEQILIKKESLYSFSLNKGRFYPLDYGFNHLSQISQEFLLQAAPFWFQFTIKNSKAQFLVKYAQSRNVDVPYLYSFVMGSLQLKLPKEFLYSNDSLSDRLNILLVTPSSEFDLIIKSNNIIFESILNNLEKEIVYIRDLLSKDNELMISLSIHETKTIKTDSLSSIDLVYIQNTYCFESETKFLNSLLDNLKKEHKPVNFLGISYLSSGFIIYFCETPSVFLEIKKEFTYESTFKECEITVNKRIKNNVGNANLYSKAFQILKSYEIFMDLIKNISSSEYKNEFTSCTNLPQIKKKVLLSDTFYTRFLNSLKNSNLESNIDLFAFTHKKNFNDEKNMITNKKHDDK